MKALPIGISTLKIIIERQMVYIDKTAMAFSMIGEPGRYFLSRPRRFGKSLFLDTLKEIFEGNEPLFRDLAIHDKWDWTKTYPVIKIDFAGGVLRNLEGLDDKLQAVVNWYAEEYQISLKERGISNRFTELVRKISQKQKSPVVVLVDEYDKPLLDNIENPSMAIAMREGLKNFYSPLKELDADLQFVFLTGVSKFSKVNIFSGINNLKDITLSSKYSGICGYTQQDLGNSFAKHLADVDMQELKIWYNGYNFMGELVYNPYDILLFISENRTYRNYWFETGTPSFLVKLFQKKNFFLPDLDNIVIGDEQLASFNIEEISPAVLLLQSGYLTIKNSFRKMGRLFYNLQIPNREVSLALSNVLFTGYTRLSEEQYSFQSDAYDAFLRADLLMLENTIKRLFAAIPYRNFTNNNILEFEGYYASVLYAYFAAINCKIIPEDITNRGQADMTVKLGDNIFIIEVKVNSVVTENGETNSALQQIRDRNYAEKYIGKPGKRVFEVGIIFSQKERNVVQFGWLEH